MADDFNQTTWIDNVTLVDAAQMNRIEAGVESAHDEAHAAQADADAAQSAAAAAQSDADAAQAAADAAQSTANAAQSTGAAAIPKALVDAKGDLLGATANDTPARIPVGSDGQVLTADAAQALGLKWAAPAASGIPATLPDAKGDIVGATGPDAAARVPIGTNGQVLTADSAQALGLKWATPAAGAALSYDGDWAAGTYQDGQVVVKDGIAYICVGGPTTATPDPVPWGAARPTKESELAYAEITASVAVTATSEAGAQTVVTAPAITVDGATSILIEFSAMQLAPPSGQQLYLFLFDGSTSLGILTIAVPGSVAAGWPGRVARRLTPSAGTHTYSIRASTSGGTANVIAGAGGVGVFVPAFVRISQPSSPIPIIPGASLPVSYGTTLPVNPVDGQEAILVDSLTNPTYQWRFRYNAGSSSAYKWEFVGGAPAQAEIETLENTASTSYVSLATAGPSFAIPRAGEYLIEIGARTFVLALDVVSFMSYDIGGTAAADVDAVSFLGAASYSSTAGGSASPNVMRSKRKTLTAVTLTTKYRASTANGAYFAGRWLRVTPARVS